jgi:hypothetical protein
LPSSENPSASVVSSGGLIHLRTGNRLPTLLRKRFSSSPLRREGLETMRIQADEIGSKAIML